MKPRALVIAIFSLSLFLAPAAAQSRKDKDQAKKFREEADKAISAKQYREAADLYGRSLQLEPTNSYAHYRKGFAHFSLKENEQAISSFTTALSQGFKPLDIYRIRYFVYFEQGNFDAALADVQKGLDLAPTDTSFLNALGEIQYERKSYSAALEAFTKLSTSPAGSGDTYYNLARVHFAMNNTEGQAAAAETALAKGTRFPGETYFLLGDAKQKLKDNKAAIDAYKRALGVKPTVYQIYSRLSDLYKAESRFDEAIETLKTGLIHFIGDGNFYTELGLLYSLAGRPADAVSAARSGVGILPNQATGYTNLCRALNEVKEYGQAVIACNNSLRIRPGDGETYFYLGNALYLNNKAAEAKRAWESAVKHLLEATSKDPGQSDLWYLLGNAYFANSAYDQAIEAYLKCLAISPKFFKARGNLGFSYARKKNKPAAMEQYNVLVSADAGLAARLKAEIDKI